MIKTLRLVYFSPTRTTKKILEGIAGGINAEKNEHTDISMPDANDPNIIELKDELVIIGAPVYGGRVAPEAVKRLRRFKSNGSYAVPVVVYGNRAYEDALKELADIAGESGFKTVACGAFIGEHSFSDDLNPIANGRPDGDDIKKAGEFGNKIQEKIKTSGSSKDMAALHIPGNVPYKEMMSASKGVSPVIMKAECTLCGICATICPTGAISVGDNVDINNDLCIRCCACVKDCPARAILMKDPMIMKIAEWLSANCKERKEPDIFM